MKRSFFLVAAILCFLPLFADAAIRKQRVPGTQSARYVWDDTKDTASGFKMTDTGWFMAKSVEKVTIEHEMGMRSGAVDLYNNKKVHRDTVAKGLWDNAKKGGKLVGRVSGWAFWAYTAYELVSPWVRRGGWLWNPENGEWERALDNNTYVVLLVNERNSISQALQLNPESLKDWCGKKPELPVVNGGRNCSVKGYYRHSDLQDAMRSACKSHSFTAFNHSTREWETVWADSIGSHGVCYDSRSKYGGILAVKAIRFNGMETMTYQQFYDLVKDPMVDVPDKAVDATRPYQGGPIPGLTDDGIFRGPSVATTQPYRNPYTGKMEQLRWDIDGDGKVKENRSSRPDLDSASDNVWSTPTPGGDTSTGTGGDTSTGTGGGSSGDGNEPPQPPPNQSLLCQVFPKILACQQMGVVDESLLDDFDIPRIENQQTMTTYDILPTNGVCPAPLTAILSGTTISLSYEPLCTLADKIRAFIIAAFAISAIYVAFGGLITRS